MKINPELERLLQAEQTKLQNTLPQKNKPAPNNFEALLDGELSNLANASSVTSSQTSQDLDYIKALADPITLTADGLASMTGTSDVSQTNGDQNIVESLMLGLQNSINSMDAYAKSLQDSTNLKSAYANLEMANRQVGTMQQDYSKLSQKNSSLESLLNDLEIMTVTETYKFNRGDYA